MKIFTLFTYLTVLAGLFISVQARAAEVPIVMIASDSKIPPLLGKNYILIGYWDMDDKEGNKKSRIRDFRPWITFDGSNHPGGSSTHPSDDRGGGYMASLGIDRRILGLVTELKINVSNKSSNSRNFVYNKDDDLYYKNGTTNEYLIGAWDVDGGGGYGNDGSYGKYMLTLSARLRENSTDRQLDDLMLVASNKKTPASKSGYEVIGYWDVDKGGSQGTDGSKGSYMMTLLAKWR